jgi:hypothetical protein
VSCEHENFRAQVDVFRLYHDADMGDSPHAFAAEVSIVCTACGAPLGFRCDTVGLTNDRPAISPDALKLRLPLLSPAELVLLGPLNMPPPRPGFTIRFPE